MKDFDAAMVLAAGLGTRMRPLTLETPKPLINVAGKALIDHALDRFSAAGVTRAVVNVHYLADQVEAHIHKRDVPDLIISDERDELLETGGGLQAALPLFPDGAIFCTNTDAIFVDKPGSDACAQLKAAWDSDEMDALLLLVPIDQTSGYDGAGDFDLKPSGKLSYRSRETAPFVFTGLQLISTELIGRGSGGAYSTKMLWDKAKAQNRLHGIVYDGFWLHVGDPAGLADAEQKLSDNNAN